MPDKFGWDNNFGNNPAPKPRHTAPPRALPVIRQKAAKITASECNTRRAAEVLTAVPDLLAALDAQSKLLAEAREALHPVAEMAPFFEQRYCAGDLVVDLSRQGEHAQLTVGDVRKTQTLLAKLKAASGEG